MGLISVRESRFYYIIVLTFLRFRGFRDIRECGYIYLNLYIYI